MLLIPWTVPLQADFSSPSCYEAWLPMPPPPVYCFGPNGARFTRRLHLCVLGAASQHQGWVNHVERLAILCSPVSQAGVSLQLWPRPCWAFPPQSSLPIFLYSPYILLFPSPCFFQGIFLTDDTGWVFWTITGQEEGDLKIFPTDLPSLSSVFHCFLLPHFHSPFSSILKGSILLGAAYSMVNSFANLNNLLYKGIWIWVLPHPTHTYAFFKDNIF